MTTWRQRAAVLAISVLILLAAGFSNRGLAADQQIAAVVNDHIISVKDVSERLGLVIVTSQLPDTPEARQRLLPEVLRGLIDEALKREEARRLNLTVSREDVEKALQRVEKQSNLPPGELPRYLASRGLDMKPLIEQVEADLVWRKVVNQQARDASNIPEEEIERETQRLALNPASPEYQVQEIFLPVDDPGQSAEMTKLAERLADDVRSGTPFAAVARSFSRSESALAGGDVGWVRADQLPPAIAATVARLAPNEVSAPIAMETGIFLLRVTGRRMSGPAGGADERVTLYQVILPVAPGEETVVRAAAERLRSQATSCDALEKATPPNASPLSGRISRIDLRQTPPEVRGAIESLAVGQPSQPMRTAEGYLVLMVCEREQPKTVTAEMRQVVERKLRQDRLEAASRRLLRDLRRSMLVDVRM